MSDDGGNEKVLRSFSTSEEADEFNAAYYRSLSPEERLEIALDMVKYWYAGFPRLEGVYRTADLGECPVSRDRWMGAE